MGGWYIMGIRVHYTALFLTIVALCVSCDSGEKGRNADVSSYVPSGPTRSFRQLCYDYNWVGRETDRLGEFFTDSDPVAFAEFSKRINLDAVLVLAVPHHGYCSYETDAGEMFPGLKYDWFGDVVNELHARDISALGYITLNWNWKYMREHLDEPFVEAKMDDDGLIDGWICLNAPGYLDLVESYTREVLTKYPVDGIRFDMTFTVEGCDCEGCRQFYRELYGEEMPSWWRDSLSRDEIQPFDLSDEMLADVEDREFWLQRRWDFYIATTTRAVKRLRTVGRNVKPTVEMWQNQLNPYVPNDLNLGRTQDISYVEFGDPFRMLLLQGILGNTGTIVGQTLKSPIRRQVMALGARCYQYVKVNPRTVLPDSEEWDNTWFVNDLAPFYAMVADIQPYLEDAQIVSPIAVVYSENTRYRWPRYSRAPYMAVMRGITERFLDRSLPLEFVNALDLPERSLDNYRMLILPETSGLTEPQQEALLDYASDGGTLLLGGGALLYDERGELNEDFSFAGEMGMTFERLFTPEDTLSVRLTVPADLGLPRQARSVLVGSAVVATSTIGGTLLEMTVDGASRPFLHAAPYGSGSIIWCASMDDADFAAGVAASYADPLLLTVDPPDKRVILTRRDKAGQYVLHFLDEGDYSVHIRNEYAGIEGIVDQYPADGWECKVSPEMDASVITASGGAANRLVVLGRE